MNGMGLVWGSVAATVVLSGSVSAAEAGGQRQVLELRTYRFASEAKLKTFADYLASALVPALNRAGIAPVGAFRLFAADNPKLNLAADELKLYVLFGHPDLASALSLPTRLAADPEAAREAHAVLGTPQKDPVYERFETQLMLAFTACPRIEAASQAPERVLQMRIYESHNDERALRKIEMFNDGGEIALFRRVGMKPVFFGQSIAGTALPNLTYMLGFDSPAAQEAAWAAFLAAPEWAALKGDAKYAETVSKITNLVLRPVAGSQL